MAAGETRQEDFAAAWASKCEELARETAKVSALIEVIRNVIKSSRPGTPPEQRHAAWRAAGAVIRVDERRQDEDFMARLARVRERQHAQQTENEHLRAIVKVLVERVEHGGPSNFVQVAEKYLYREHALLLEAVLSGGSSDQ